MADRRPDLYGSSTVVVGMLTRNPKLALELARYLATETAPLLRFAKGLRNIPTTSDALEDLLLEQDSNYHPFLLGFKHSRSTSPPMLPEGPFVYYSPVDDFLGRWQQGDGVDLQSGLRRLNDEIDAKISASRPS